MSFDTLTGNYNYTGIVTFSGTLSLPISTPCVGDDQVKANAGIDYTKLDHQNKFVISQTGTVVNGTHYLTIVGGTTSTLLKVSAAITEVLADDASRTINIDLQKSTGGGAFATMLSSTLELDSADTLLTEYEATLGSVALVDGDILKLTITVAGGSGNQAQGLIVQVILREDP